MCICLLHLFEITNCGFSETIFFIPVVQLVLLLSFIQLTSISRISPLDLRLMVSWLTMNNYNIGGVMVSMLASSAVDRGFEPTSGQTKDYKIGICCFSSKHATVRNKRKDWLARNQNNLSEWSEMSTHRLLFQWASTMKIQLGMLV